MANSSKRSKTLLKRFSIVAVFGALFCFVSHKSTTPSTPLITADSDFSRHRRLSHSHTQHAATADGDDIPLTYDLNTDKPNEILIPASIKPPPPPTLSSKVKDVLFVSLASFLVFLGLAIVCDDYLCEAISIVCTTLEIPHDIAGATLLAFGSSAPEIFMNASATLKGKVSLSLPAILGSAIIAFGFIPPICAFAVNYDMKLRTWPVLRDSGLYVISLTLMWQFMKDGFVDRYESMVLAFVYVFYLGVLVLPYAVGGCLGGGSGGVVSVFNEKGEYESIEESTATVASTEEGDGSDESEEEEDEDENDSFSSRVLSFFSCPFNILFSYTIPVQSKSTSTQQSLFKPSLTILISLAYVTAFSSLALDVASSLSTVLNLSQTTAGATLLAFGAQIPDTFGSLAMTKGGMPGGAVSNAIGSQVINISLGIGFPFYIYNVYYDQEVFVGHETSGMTILLKLLLLVIVCFWVVMFPVGDWIACNCSVGECRLNKVGGVGLGWVGVGCYAAFVYLQEIGN